MSTHSLLTLFPVQPPPSNANAQAGSYPNDLTNATTMNGGPGSITPTRKERPMIDTKRKQTLLSLLEALTELQKDTASHSSSTSACLLHCIMDMELTTIFAQRLRAGFEERERIGGT